MSTNINCCLWPKLAGQTGNTVSGTISLPINLSATLTQGCIPANSGTAQVSTLLQQQLQHLQQLHQQNLQNMMNLLSGLANNNVPFQALASTSAVNTNQPSLPQSTPASTAKTSPTSMLVDGNKYEATINLKDFKPENINVTLACDHIQVEAENQEYTPTSASKTKVCKNFMLPQNVIPDTIECLLAPDGTLTITAKLYP
ncbi:uncharacterized protein LOC126268017 [Schistocerca gregaria]|uniref:uncharacterized protein LOC126268017 n=1 Tax=Schistocerca gregaria TaxID=7010 RepID=UPI00211DF79B|nr:uncharacterized protein LOC126268017 [Schistocerca gregaria]